MTAVDTDSTRGPSGLAEPPAARDDQRRRRLWGAVGAAVVLLATTAIIVVGRIPLPDFPSLAAAPDDAIPGVVAYVEGGRDGSCVMVVAASGLEPREVACRFDWVDALAWTAAGDLVVLSYAGMGPEVVVLDADDGRVLERISTDSPPDPFALHRDRQVWEGQRLEVDDDGAGHPVVRVHADGGSRLLIAAEGPRDYRFESAQWSPDGDWALVLDSRGRLLVVGADATPGPRMLADAEEPGYTAPAWHIPGNDTFTVDPSDL